jgi:hypothetical protein
MTHLAVCCSRTDRLCRATVRPVRHLFKQNWGFEPQALHYEYELLKSHFVPQNNPSNPKHRALIKLWRRLQRPMANALGPSIVRNLG